MSESMQTLKLVLKEGIKINSNNVHNLKYYLDGRKVKNIKIEFIEVISKELDDAKLMDKNKASAILRIERQAETSRQSTKKYKEGMRIAELKMEKLRYQKMVEELQLECEVARIECVKLHYQLESECLRVEIANYRNILESE